MAKTKILVISGNPAMLRLLQRNLSAGAYEIATCQDTSEGLRAVIDEEQPDLIILDIMMPRLDGIEVCLRIRHWCLTPIMMLSTWGAGEGKVRGLNLGADSYLTEPFGIGELESRMKNVLRRNLIAASRHSRLRSGISWEQ